MLGTASGVTRAETYTLPSLRLHLLRELVADVFRARGEQLDAAPDCDGYAGVVVMVRLNVAPALIWPMVPLWVSQPVVALVLMRLPETVPPMAVLSG